MKLTKDEIMRRIRDNSQILRSRYPIESIALFGSYARDEQNENSDIDILVDFNKPVGMEVVDLAIELENILEQEVDLVTYNAIKNRLFNYVKSDLIYA